MSYYLLQNDETKGPYTIGQLRAMWNSGVITADTLYCREGWSEWLPLLGMIRDLEPPAEPPPLPPPVITEQSYQAPPKKGIGFIIWCLLIFVSLIVIGAIVGALNQSDTSSTSPTSISDISSSTPSPPPPPRRTPKEEATSLAACRT